MKTGERANGDSQAPALTSTAVSGKDYGIVVALFLLSGFSSLIYQVVWTRQLVFVFGSTTFASSTVLAVFMGGLALGSFLAARVSDRLTIGRALLWYGLLEGIIGCWAFIVPSMFEQAIPIYRAIWQQQHLSLMPFSLLRFAVATVILLPPTTCMGATLPLLSRFVVANLSTVGRRVGTLYAINTLGAVLGSLISGFVLLPTIGLHATNVLSAEINIFLLFVVGLLVWNRRDWLSAQSLAPEPASSETVSAPAEPTLAPPATPGKKKSRKERRKEIAAAKASQTGEEPAAASASEENKIPAEPIASTNTHRKTKLTIAAATLAFAVSGGIAMMYEVAWTRALLMVVGSTTYAFTCMLATFLIGIFLGSLIASRFVDRFPERALALFSFSQLLLGVVGFACIYVFNFVPYWSLIVTIYEWETPALAQLSRFALSGVVLLPISLLFGATFPFVVKACTERMEAIGQSVGSLYSANTCGAIVGAFLAGFVVVPIMGVETTLLLCSCLSLVVGALLLFFACPRVPRIRIAIISSAIILIGSAAVTFAKVWDDLALLDTQTMRRSFRWNGVDVAGIVPYHEWVEKIHKRLKLLCYYDGACGTAGVFEHLATKKRSLLTNGHIDASYGDQSTQVLLAGFPLCFNPKAKDICVIGWGSGVTAGVAGLWKPAQTVAVEIEPSVVRASRLFSAINQNPYANPRVKLEVNDGRNYLLATDRMFDIIISEPSNPWQSGVCNLFTKEYFQSTRRCLKPDGVFGMWLQINENSPENVLRILSALHSVYPYLLPMQTKHGDYTILASSQPIMLERDKVNAVLRDPQMRAQFDSIGIHSPHDVAARIVVTPQGVDEMVRNIPPNTDDLNYLEYGVSRTYETVSYNAENTRMFVAHAGKLWDCINWENAPVGQKAFTCGNIALDCLTADSPARAKLWADESLRLEQKNPVALVALASSEMQRGLLESARKYFKAALAVDPDRPYTLVHYLKLSRAIGDLDTARKLAQQLLTMAPASATARYEVARTYLPSFRHFDDGDFKGEDQPQKAKELLEPFIRMPEITRSVPGSLAVWAIANYKTGGNKADSIAAMGSYLTIRDLDAPAARILAKWHKDAGHGDTALKYEKIADHAARVLIDELILDAQTDYDRDYMEASLWRVKQAMQLGATQKVLPVLDALAPKLPEAKEIAAKLNALPQSKDDAPSEF